VQASHPGPGIAVTCLAMLLSSADQNPARLTLLLGLAVLSGQLTVGWTNDLLDAPRDAQVGRTDKPVAAGLLAPGVLQVAIVLALALCVLASLLCGLAAGFAHLVLVVGAGWAYNLGLKRTWWSWAPYAVAFGTLPAVVTLAGDPSRMAPWWMIAVGALLGVGAHVVNTLPDLADDVATGVRGMPHRLGERAARALAAAVLGGASLIATLGPPGGVPVLAWAALALVCGLAVVTVRGNGKRPFQAAVAIALLDVTVLVLRS